jgi:hypothetical protein
MKRIVGTLVLLSTTVVGSSLAEESATLIAQAVLALPEHLRDEAAVILDTGPGEREVLRKGSNGLICRADSSRPGFFVQCFHEGLDAMFQRYFALLGAGTPSEDVPAILDAEIKAGKFRVPAGAAEYILTGQSLENALPIMTVTIPGATGESTGLSTEPSAYRPWLMWAGTEVAHVMIPGK